MYVIFNFDSVLFYTQTYAIYRKAKIFFLFCLYIESARQIRQYAADVLPGRVRERGYSRVDRDEIKLTRLYMIALYFPTACDTYLT